MYKKILLSLFLIALMQLSFVKVVDINSSAQLDKAFTRALSVFAIARGLNGLISVAQGTEVYATPAGVGVNFAVGQFLDPMNDMVERFSWVMLMSSVSLGIQELMLNFGQTQLVQVLLAMSVLFLLGVLWIPKFWNKTGFNLLFKAFVIFSVLRFFVPIFILLNEGIYTYVLEEEYTKAKASLEMAQIQTESIVQKVHENRQQQNSSWMDSLNIKQQVDDFRLKIQHLWENLSVTLNNAVEYILSLIAIFITQSILLPLFFLWTFLKVFKRLIRADIAVFIDSSREIQTKENL